MNDEPAAAEGSNGSIAEILLRRGFVTETELEQALERQRQTRQPLGQLLVEDGTITRLELATALAEQWADSPILPDAQRDPRPGWRGGPDVPRALAPAQVGHDVDRESFEQLRQAVVELGRRVSSGKPSFAGVSEDVASTVTTDELDLRLAELLARIEPVDAGVRALADHVERLVTEIADAFHELDDRTTAATQKEDALAARLDELTGRVAQLTSRPAPEDAAPRVDDLSFVVESLARRVDGLAGRSAHVEGVAARVEQLSSRVQELEARLAKLEDGARAKSRDDARLREDIPPAVQDLEDGEATLLDEQDIERLERMSSAIDWRLRRLEDAGPGSGTA